MPRKEEKNFRTRGRSGRKSEFEQKVVDIARVARVVKGGKRFSFRTVIVIGDRKGRVGIGIAKGPDMKISTEKAFTRAKKNIVKVNIKGNTIPYQVYKKLGSAKILLKPAVKGKGVVAGGAVRAVISLAGISDISAKMLGSSNRLNNARATVEALKQFSQKTTRDLELEKIKERNKEQKKKIEDKETELKKAEEIKS